MSVNQDTRATIVRHVHMAMRVILIASDAAAMVQISMNLPPTYVHVSSTLLENCVIDAYATTFSILIAVVSISSIYDCLNDKLKAEEQIEIEEM